MGQCVVAAGACRLDIEFLKHLDRQRAVASIKQRDRPLALARFIGRATDRIEQKLVSRMRKSIVSPFGWPHSEGPARRKRFAKLCYASWNAPKAFRCWSSKASHS
jgi:hypothetical protein